MELNVYENDIDKSVIRYNPNRTVTIKSVPEQSLYYSNANYDLRVQQCLFVSSRQFLIGDTFYAMRGESKDYVVGLRLPSSSSSGVVTKFSKRVVTRISPYNDFYNQMPNYTARDQFVEDAKEFSYQIITLNLLFTNKGIPFTLPEAGEFLKEYDRAKGNVKRINELANQYAKALHESVEANIQMTKEYHIDYLPFKYTRTK